MKNFEQQLRQAAQNIKFDAKAKIKQSVFDYVALTPVRTPNKKSKIGVIVGILLLLFTSGGMAFVAQAALPGELLYPVKLATEEIHNVIILDPVKKAEWAVKRVKRRVAESIILEQKNKFKPAVRKALAEKLTKQIKRANQRLKQIENRRPKLVHKLRTNIQTYIEVSSINKQIKSKVKQIQKKAIRKIRQIKPKIIKTPQRPPKLQLKIKPPQKIIKNRQKIRQIKPRAVIKSAIKPKITIPKTVIRAAKIKTKKLENEVQKPITTTPKLIEKVSPAKPKTVLPPVKRNIKINPVKKNSDNKVIKKPRTRTGKFRKIIKKKVRRKVNRRANRKVNRKIKKVN